MNWSVLAVFALVLVVFLAGCPQQATVQPGPQAPQPVPNVTAPAPGIEQPGATGPGITERPDYLTTETFAKLPPFPRDLYRLRNQIKYGEFWDLATIGEEYYAQPEFYPTFEQAGVPFLQSPSGISPYGFGAYPSDMQILTFKNDNITIATFFYTAWGVQTYQGLAFSPTVTDGEGKEVADVADVEVEPQAIVLAPNYPVFEKGWAQKVLVKIRVKEKAPLGTYTVNLNLKSIPQDKSAEWSAKYGNQYTEGGMFQVSVDRPYFRVALTIT
ncbi:MAG: hypothetical protein WC759_01230 [Candidatus Micrarchaeia archaeon]